MSTVQSVIGVLGDFYDMYRGEPEYEELFATYDIGFPLAWLTCRGEANPTEWGASAIRETWYAFCNAMRVDPHNDFTSFTEMQEFLESLPEGTQ
jgi:hypothetical protein